MRLTTLARKIQITPTKLIEYLQKNDVTINNGVNSILDEETVAVVMQKFMPQSAIPNSSDAPSVMKKIEVNETEQIDIAPPVFINAPEASSVETNTNFDIVLPENKVISKPTEAASEPETPTLLKTGTIDDLELGLSEDIELIKAKKVKLEGIKVIGKIEIPEKAKKVEITEKDKNKPEQQPDAKKETGTTRYESNKNDIRKKRSLKAEKNRPPLTYDEKLKLEEKEKRRIQKQKARKEKELKKKFYLKNIQPKNIGQPKKKRKSSVGDHVQATQKVIKHKNPIRRFWAWLNGAYDKD
jgi:hypothetical protein